MEYAKTTGTTKGEQRRRQEERGVDKGRKMEIKQEQRTGKEKEKGAWRCQESDREEAREARGIFNVGDAGKRRDSMKKRKEWRKGGN